MIIALTTASNRRRRRWPRTHSAVRYAITACALLCLSRSNNIVPMAFSFTTPSHVSSASVSVTSPRALFLRSMYYNNRITDNSSYRRLHYHAPSSRNHTILQSTANSVNIIPARRSRFAFELKTFLRVLFPALLSGAAAVLALPNLCFRVASFVTRTTDPGQIGVLSDAVQSFISLVGLLYSILMGQVFGFLYSQQEALYLALFDEVTEAKSLLEQVALVSQGRSMYLTCLTSIARYVREDLLGGTMTLVPSNNSNNHLDNNNTTSGKGKNGVKKVPATPSVTPSILLSARPADDPLEAILYLTSVGIPGNIYDTVRSLRQARSRRLGAMQRKVPVIHLLMLWIMGVTLILTFPTLIGVGGVALANGVQDPWSSIWTLPGMLFGLATFAVVLTKMVLFELWRTKGGAYNVDSVLRVMVRGLECELDERMAEAKQTMKRSKGQ